MDKHLHIISLTVPYPVDYGGVFDLFYKLRALHEEGVKIHLHCFKYGRAEQEILKQYCETVHYYPRRKWWAALSFRIPYIVKSRSNTRLEEVIAGDEYPVLMEGIHCTALLHHKRLYGRKFFVRLHNVEHIYYKRLYRLTGSILKKVYYIWESYLLRSYEAGIVKKAVFLAVSEKDVEVYKTLKCEKVYYLPLFLPPWKIERKKGRGSFCLYHGDLSVIENEKAAYWLLVNVFKALTIPFVVAGKNPSSRFASLVETHPLACMVANPSAEEMQDLIAKAHINVLPSFNLTGIKLKVVNALFNGRHCVVNDAAVEGTGLERACVIADTADSFKDAITALYEKDFNEYDSEIRQDLLTSIFNNKKNATELVRRIWSA